VIVKVLILVGLVRLLGTTDSPGLCTGIYAAAVITLGFMTKAPLATIAIAGGGSILVFGLYFWLLNRYQSGILYWLIFIIGIPVCLFL
jgi:4-amino-4-deoxy-L-arabinose transferase-like glycosyltransferase